MEAVTPISTTAIPDMVRPRVQAGEPAQPGMSGQVDESRSAVENETEKASENDKTQPSSLSSLAKELNDAMAMFSTDISFSIDKDTGKTVIKVIDNSTKEVIRQIPPEDVLRIAARIKELVGILYDHTQ